MSAPGEGASAPDLERRRQSVIDLLCERFADDAMSVEEFERRVDSAHGASTSEELDALLRDLPGRRPLPVRPSGGAVQGYSTVSPDRVQDRDLVLAIMGGTTRKGRWTPARRNYAIALMGGAELDFREAILPPGVTEVHIYAMWGGVDVIVPPDLHVESRGFAIMGGFEHAADEAVAPGPETPTLRLTGLAIMGGVDISVRRPGETAREARRRRRIEAKERRRLGE